MRYKVVPPVRSVAFLRTVGDALPLVPGSVEDCCTRIRNRTDLQSREAAREYLTFCRALGLAREADGEYYRPRERPAIAAGFRERVFGAEEVLAALAEPREAAAVFPDVIEPVVPQWERERTQDWRATWRERTGRLLGWGVAFGLLERTGEDRFVRSA